MKLSPYRPILILSLAGQFGLGALSARTQARPAFERSASAYRRSSFRPPRSLWYARPYYNSWGFYGVPYTYGYYNGAYPWGCYGRPYGWGWGGYPHHWSWRGQHHSFGPRYFGHRSFGRCR